jgi:hypothetical protein
MNKAERKALAAKLPPDGVGVRANVAVAEVGADEGRRRLFDEATRPVALRRPPRSIGEQGVDLGLKLVSLVGSAATEQESEGQQAREVSAHSSNIGTSKGVVRPYEP